MKTWHLTTIFGAAEWLVEQNLVEFANKLNLIPGELLILFRGSSGITVMYYSDK
jgi:hypothetical protein